MDNSLMKGGFGTIFFANMALYSRITELFNGLGRRAVALTTDTHGFTNKTGAAGRDPLVEGIEGHATATIVSRDVIQQEEVGRNEPNDEWGAAPPN